MQLFISICYKPNTNNISKHFIRVFIILNKISLYQVQTSVFDIRRAMQSDRNKKLGKNWHRQ